MYIHHIYTIYTPLNTSKHPIYALNTHHYTVYRYYGPFADGNEMGVRGWVPVAATAGPTKNTLVVDLSHLPEGATVSAIRYGAGSGGYNATTGEYLDRGLGKSLVCCGPHVDIALQP